MRPLRHRIVSLISALVALAWAAVGVPAAAPALASQHAEIAAEIRAACGVPHKWLLRMWRGTRQDWGGDIQLLPAYPNFVSGGISHAGPWPYLQQVPLLFYGPGTFRPMTSNRPVISTDIAPTEGQALNFTFNAPDGHPLTDALLPASRRSAPPRLLVTLVWDAGGMDVLNAWPKQWPYLRSLIPRGAWFSNVTVGSSPSNTPPIHSTIGTGAYPQTSGTLDEFVRVGGQIEKPNELGPAFQLVPTLADLYDRAMGNKPIVGEVATLSAHIGMMGHGSMWHGGDRDIAITREALNAPTAGAESVNWNLSPHMAPYYTFPKYVNSVPGFQRDILNLDKADGKQDGYWRTNNIQQLLGGFDTPARTPYETRVIEEIIKREGFGKDKIPDLLYINYKTIDTIGHMFTINSPEMKDAVSYQDTYLRVLVNFLNRQVGKGKWAMVLTADHGHQYSPTVSGAWQIDVTHMQNDIQQHFDTDSDSVPLVEKIRPTQIWLNQAELARNHVTVADVARYVQGLTQAQTTKPNTTPAPGHANDTVFKAVFPNSLFPKLPCLPEAHA